MNKFWITPPEIYKKLDEEFCFDFDPCPYPRPAGFDGIKIDWGNVSFVNPPFRKKDAFLGSGPTTFARKSVLENQKGKTIVLLLPTQSYVNLLLTAGAEIRPMGRIRWLDGETKKPCSGPSSISCFILRPPKIH